MNLIVDIGNTKIKVAVFEGDRMIFKESCLHEELKNNLKKIVNIFSKIENIVVSNVGKIGNEVFLELFLAEKCFFVSNAILFPFENCYATPKTLGIDRMVLAAGAVLQYKEQNRLVIDAGTCITYDFVDSKNRYLGGGISPGIGLRYKSLNNYTAKLPLLEKQYPEKMIGDSTENAIHSGVVNGVLHEIEGTIEAYLKIYENFIIILTGGDAEFLAKRLKNTIFANSNFLLVSLNQLFQYNQND